jgi:hypothetical protein
MSAEGEIPAYAFTPARHAAVRAMNARGDSGPNVEIRCGADHKGAEWGGPVIGGVWFTDVGDVLVVKWMDPEGDVSDFLDVEKNSTWSAAPHHRLADDFMVEEQPVLLSRPGQRFPAWCRVHGSWNLDESAIERDVQRAKRTRRMVKYRAMPPE